MNEDILKDRIGRDEIVNKLKNLIDKLVREENFCLALNGEWGSGKTFVMQMLQNELVNTPEYIVINYDAWKNNFYHDPLIAILYCILDGLKDYVNKNQNIGEIVKEFNNAILKSMKEIGGVPGIIAGFVETIRTMIKNLRSTIKDNVRFKDYVSYQTLLENTKQCLNNLTSHTITEGKTTKLIILVDELDRCLPDEQLIVLERLHHLFDVKNCAVIVALNQLSVANSVNTIYGVNGFEYLRKFFDFSFKLEMSSEEYIKSLFFDLSEKLKKVNTEFIWDNTINLCLRCFLHSEKNVLKNIDNREITRYFVAVNKICAEFGWEKLISTYLFFIIIALFIRKFLCGSFMDEDEVIENQSNVQVKDKQKEMPYFDYLNKYFGIDVAKMNGNGTVEDMDTHILSYSWNFNKMVYYTIKNNEPIYYFNNNIFIGDTSKVNCEILKELILRFGGETINDIN